MNRPTDEDRLRAADDLRENLPWIVGDVKAMIARIERMMMMPGYVWPNGVVFSEGLMIDMGKSRSMVHIDIHVDLPGSGEAAREYLRMEDELAMDMYKKVWVVLEKVDGETEVLMVHIDLEMAKIQVKDLEQLFPESEFRIERSAILDKDLKPVVIGY